MHLITRGNFYRLIGYMLLGIFWRPLIPNNLRVIFNVHTVYLHTYPCPVVTIGQVLCFVIRATTAGGSFQGDSCTQSTLNQPLTKHVGLDRRANSLLSHKATVCGSCNTCCWGYAVSHSVKCAHMPVSSCNCRTSPLFGDTLNHSMPGGTHLI